MYIKDIVILKRIQKHATKYILNGRLSSYHSRLLALNLLPLMYYLELMDILFLVKCLQFPDPSFDIRAFVSFSNLSTLSGFACKLVYRCSSTNKSRHFYFNRVVTLWNSLPLIDVSQSFSCIKSSFLNVFWEHFVCHFDSDDPCSFHYLCPCSTCQLLVTLVILVTFLHSLFL